MDLITGIQRHKLFFWSDNLIVKSFYLFFSNILNVIAYCIAYTLASPFVALMEIGKAGKNALIHRDLNLFQDKDKVHPINGNPGSNAT